MSPPNPTQQNTVVRWVTFLCWIFHSRFESRSFYILMSVITNIGPPYVDIFRLLLHSSGIIQKQTMWSLTLCLILNLERHHVLVFDGFLMLYLIVWNFWWLYHVEPTSNVYLKVLNTSYLHPLTIPSHDLTEVLLIVLQWFSIKEFSEYKGKKKGVIDAHHMDIYSLQWCIVFPCAAG